MSAIRPSLCHGLILLLTLLVVGGETCVVQAAPLTASQRREISGLRRTISRAASYIRRKDVEEGEKLLNEAEATLSKVQKEAELADTDRTVAGYRKQISIQRNLLLKLKGEEGEDTSAVSFAKDVAPILESKCGNCHVNRSSGGLSLANFADMEKGGSSGPLLVVGNPASSLIMARLNGLGGKPKMPRNGTLTAKEMQTIALWIQQGAKYDGADRNLELSKVIEATKPKPPAVAIAKPTGMETVSFTKDIAPWMVNLCLGCHNDRRKSSGFSLQTFEKLMQGGDSGRVVLPGNLDGSRMWDLVGKQDPFKMPRGQALITRTNWNDLKTWIVEGAKFDGDDPKKALRDLVPTEGEVRAAELAKLSDQEFVQHRMTRSEELWKRVVPKDQIRWVESPEVIVYGNVSQERLKEIDGWSQDIIKQLRKTFNAKEAQLWKGKLAIFVMKDRFGYDEWNLVIDRRRAPREMVGHSVVDPSYDDAYIVALDVGDSASTDTPSMKTSLTDHLTGAFLRRSGGKLPEWALRGTGLALAAQANPESDYFKMLKTMVPGLVGSIGKPEDVFADGTFSPSGTGAVGYTLVEFMLKQGGAPKFGRFIRSIQSDGSVAAAMKAVYQADLKSVAQAYFASLSKSGR